MKNNKEIFQKKLTFTTSVIGQIKISANRIPTFKQNMRIPFICLLTFILAFSTAIELPSNPMFKDVKASVCDYTKINNGIKQFSEFFKADNYTSPESIAVFILGVSSTIGPATECLTKIGDWVTGINTVSKTLFTDVCLNPEETQTKNDVCCNTE
jgi:hypothetical protein